MQSGKLRAGVTEVEYKPELGLMMADGAPVAKGYLTPLYIKALVLSNDDDEVAVVALDLIGLDAADARRAAELANRRCGVPAHAILMACSHTHVAPSSTPSSAGYREAFNPYYTPEAKRREVAFVDMIVEIVADAVCEAKARQQEASIGVVSADLPWLIFNRRRHTRNYGVWTHWMGIPKDQAYRPEGPIDPDFGLFVVRGADHRPICMVWNFAGHNSFNFGDQYSADLPFTVQSALDERMGVHVPCLYTPGCGANINYFDYGQAGGLEKATEGVASAIMAIYREACTLPEVKLGSRQAELFFAPRDASRYWWRHDIESKLPSWIPFGQKEIERRTVTDKEQATFQFNVTALRLGEAALVGLPGEMFVEFGLMIKERSPFRHTYVAAYSNGRAGYIATRRAFMGGSYEAWHTSARAGREGGYLMVDKAVDLLEDLYTQ